MLGVVLLLVSLIFAGQVVIGIRTGIVRIPLKIIEIEEFERSENPTNFWGVIGFNAVMAVGLFVYEIALL